MALVNYSDSGSEAERAATPHPAKKRRIASKGNAEPLPPLPASFLDQYSSTVRTSTQDDPSLHGGRKRVTPHVEGHWPTHVYVEWHPTPAEHRLLSPLVASTAPQHAKGQNGNPDGGAHSLLHSDLGVPLPLHISLSRPLVLKTDQKETFLAQLQRGIQENGVYALEAAPKDVTWHPNESATRWFLVIRLKPSPELSKLLCICNGVAREFEQPSLYAEDGKREHDGNQFHLSIAWSLQAPVNNSAGASVLGSRGGAQQEAGIPSEHLERLCALRVNFKEVKVRIGQDVHVVRLKSRRVSTTS